MDNVDLLFKTLFFPELDADDELAVSIYSDESNKVSDGNVHPVELFFEKAALALAKLPANDDDWDEEIGADAPLHKRADGQIEKRSSSPYKIRLEKTQIDGQTYILGYNFEGENVYTRFLDGSEE